LDLFKKIIQVTTVRVPQAVRDGMKQNFPSAKNIEWSRNKSLFEVIFYQDDLEKIARFDSEGTLLEYRINLPLERIPTEIREKASSEGEIMNCIEFHSVDAIRFEFIVRDEALIRYLLLTDMSGKKIRREKL
jgi:hypothetical protein